MDPQGTCYQNFYNHSPSLQHTDSYISADVDINNLSNHPKIQQLQDLMAQNPALIQSLLEQFAAENPEIQEETLIQLIELIRVDQNFKGNDGDSLSPDTHMSKEERKAIDQVNILVISGSCAVGLFRTYTILVSSSRH